MRRITTVCTTQLWWSEAWYNKGTLRVVGYQIIRKAHMAFHKIRVSLSDAHPHPQ